MDATLVLLCVTQAAFYFPNGRRRYVAPWVASDRWAFSRLKSNTAATVWQACEGVVPSTRFRSTERRLFARQHFQNEATLAASASIRLAWQQTDGDMCDCAPNLWNPTPEPPCYGFVGAVEAGGRDGVRGEGGCTSQQLPFKPVESYPAAFAVWCPGSSCPASPCANRGRRQCDRARRRPRSSASICRSTRWQVQACVASSAAARGVRQPTAMRRRPSSACVACCGPRPTSRPRHVLQSDCLAVLWAASDDLCWGQVVGAWPP